MNQQSPTRRSRCNAQTAMARVCWAPFPTDPQPTQAELARRLNAWREHQMTVLELVFGDAWPAHREWARSLLKHEARVRLAAMGWRVK